MKRIMRRAILTLATMVSAFIPVAAPAGRIDEVMLLPMSHLDIGFTAPLDTVAMQSKQHLDEAIRLCTDYPDFRWTIESIWQFEEWRKRSDPDEIEELLALIRGGRIELGATAATWRSGFFGPEETDRVMDDMHRLEAEYGLKFRTVLQNDVPGFIDAWPRVFSEAGIEFFVCGVNSGHGGGTSLTRNQMPFHWQSMDGSEILTWVDHDGYISVWPWGLYDPQGGEGEGFPNAGAAFLENVHKLEESGYPHSVLMLSGALGDNISPRVHERMIRAVREWNEAELKPSLTFATPSEFHDRLLEEIDPAALPRHSGNWHGLWDARVWNPAGNQLGRRAARLLPGAEALATINQLAGRSRYPRLDIEQGYRNLLLHYEHTAGGDPSWLGLFDPRFFREVAERQNRLTLRFAMDAEAAADRIVGDQLAHLAGERERPVPGILLFNPNPWEWRGSVRCLIPRSLAEESPGVFDGVTGERLRFTLEDISTLTVACPPLPPFSAGWVEIRKNDAPLPENRTPALENAWYALAFEEETGLITSVMDKDAGLELLNSGSGFCSPMQILYHDAHKPGWGTPVVQAADVALEVCAEGSRLVINREHSWLPLTTITLPDHEKRIDVLHTVDRSEFENVSMEDHSTYYGFEFDLSLDPEELNVQVSGTDGFFRWPDDYLPGAVLGAVQSVDGVHLREEGGYGVTIAAREAFTWTVSDVNLMRRPRGTQDAHELMVWGGASRSQELETPVLPRIFSIAVQHASEGWTADEGRSVFEDTEPGGPRQLTYHYTVRSSPGPFDAGEETQFMRLANREPFTRFFWKSPSSESLGRLSQSALTLRTEGDLSLSLRLDDENQPVATVRDSGGMGGEVEVEWRGAPRSLSLSVTPHGVAAGVIPYGVVAP